MKNSIKRLGLATAATLSLFVLAACEDKEEDPVIYGSLAACYENEPDEFDNDDISWEDLCDLNFAAAQEQHEQYAPRYSSISACEQEHGYGQCGGGSDSSIIMPLMMGLVMAELIDEIGDSYEAKYKSRIQPVYSSSKSSGYHTYSGGSRSQVVTKTTTVYTSTTTYPKPTSTTNTLNRSTTTSVPIKPVANTSAVNKPTTVPVKPVASVTTKSPVTAVTTTIDKSKTTTNGYVAQPTTPVKPTTAPAALDKKVVKQTGGFGAKATSKPAYKAPKKTTKKTTKKKSYSKKRK